MNGMIANLSRGVYDFKATLFRNNDKNQGVAIELKNFISDNDTSLKKRMGTTFLYELHPESVLVPFDYDDDQHYLMEFKYSNTKPVCQFYQYINGKLTLGGFGRTKYTQPNFSSNTQSGYEISDAKSSNEAYKKYIYGYGSDDKKAALMTSQVEEVSGRMTDYWCQIKFPKPINISSVRYIYTNRSDIYPSTGTTHIFMCYWATVEIWGSNDGEHWTVIKKISNEEPETSRAGFKYSPDIEILEDKYYSYLRFYCRDIRKTSSYPWPDWADKPTAAFGSISISGVLEEETKPVDTTITPEQAKNMRYTQQWRKIVFASEEFAPVQFTNTFANYSPTGLQFELLGYPKICMYYQQRMLFNGFSNQPLQFNLSKAGDTKEFTLNTENTTASDPIQGVMQEQVFKPCWAYGGRNVLYIGSKDGIFVIQSGNGTAVTATQIDAHLRLAKPCADMDIVKNEDVGYFVGADEESIYSFDFDRQVDRMTAVKINEHCQEKFRSGVKKIIGVNGTDNYLIALLNNGTMVMCFISNYLEFTSPLSDVGNQGYFSFYPIESEMTILDVMKIRDNETGDDKVFLHAELPNGKYGLLSLDSFDMTNVDHYWEDKVPENGIDGLKQLFAFQDANVLLDSKYTATIEQPGEVEIYVYQNPQKLYGWDLYNSLVPSAGLLGEGYSLTENPAYKEQIYNRNGSVWGFGPEGYEYRYLFGGATPNGDGGKQLLLSLNDTVIPQTPQALKRNSAKDVDYQTPPSGKYLIAGNVDLPWDNAVEVHLSDNNGHVLVLKNLEKTTGGWFAEIEASGIFLFDTIYTSYEAYYNKWVLPEVFKDLPLQAVQEGKVTECTWTSDGLLETKTPMKSGVVFGMPYTAMARYVNLENVKTISYYKTVSKIGVQSVCSFGIEVATNDMVFAKLEEFKDVALNVPGRMLPIPSYQDAKVGSNSCKNPQIAIKSDLPFYVEIGFIMYDIGVK